MTTLQIWACIIVFNAIAAVTIIWLFKRQSTWTRCWHCGIYFDQHGNTTWFPAEGTVSLAKSVCKRCLNNEQQADRYAKR